MESTISLIVEALQYDFILKALLVGSLIAVCCSYLGLFLVLKKYSMIGDGLAHVSFATIALALLLSASPLLVSIPLVILSSFLILKLNEKADLHGDAAIGLISSFAVAAGVLISSVAGGFNIDLFSYLFGSILVISNLDVILSLVLSAVVIFTIFFFYNNLFAITYDEEFARVIGLRTRTMNYLISILTSITIVLGIRVVGTMLISSLIVFPTVTALQVSKGFKSTIFISTLISVSCVILGVFLSFILNFPTGATIVFLNAVCFVLCFGLKKLNLA
ncbi:zinc transport system permease protein [Hydrogenispora ethanolica]|uniref:Zinc transport system permease protein n=1 Tax=Hydrogenispora ethanolica TaxID=1082276 RepID=A0A4R1RQ69_HYDET|nr:metal ABC transporter permease [Hydrogenispora ethanolica]TCL68538.1 zinc transport system permease protein [Hydrogenispora ethanolica]